MVQAETGSGKTTQLPKICLAIGRAEQGAICLTQPRRIAARSVATRIAQELAALEAIPPGTVPHVQEPEHLEGIEASSTALRAIADG